MSFAEDIRKKALNKLIKSSSKSPHKLEWIPCSDITDIKPAQIDNVYCGAINNKLFFYDEKLMLLCLGSSEECTPTFVSEFARIYSLPTQMYNNDVSQYRRYSKWLKYRNRRIR